MTRREEVQRFLERFDASMRSQGGGVTGVEATVLEQLVRETSPEVVAIAVRGFLDFGRDQKARAYYQRAFALAGMYQIVYDDEALWEIAERAARTDGMTDAIPRVRPSPGTDPPAPPGIHFAIDPRVLAKGDVYPIVRLVSFERADAAQRARLASLRGRCVLSFDLPDDGRYVWESADVRRFVARLHEALPYFPYFLIPAADAKQLLIYYGCLADPDARGADGSILLVHDSVVARVVDTIASLFAVCDKTGEEAGDVIRDTFAAWPPQVVDHSLRRLRELLDQ